MTSFLALRASVCVSNSPGMLFLLFLYLLLLAIYVVSSMSVECLIPLPPARMEQLPGLDTVARMEQLPGWNNYLGSNLRPQTTRAVTLPIGATWTASNM